MAALFVVEADFAHVCLDLVLAEQVAELLPPAFAMPIKQSAVEVGNEALVPGVPIIRRRRRRHRTPGSRSR